MEEISLSNGQKSEIFQPAKDYGSSGSIYLKTRKPRFNKDEKYHIRAAFKTGSFGLVNPSVSVSYTHLDVYKRQSLPALNTSKAITSHVKPA